MNTKTQINPNPLTDIHAVNLDYYLKSYLFSLSKQDQQTIRETHLKRITAGSDEWNTWAKAVTEQITQQIDNRIKRDYPEGDATEQQKKAIKQKVFNQYHIDFSDHHFNESLYCDGFIFPIRANFSSAKFSENTYFSESKFTGEANFREAQFTERADFLAAQFTERANFFKAKFTGKADFNHIKFEQEANFSNTTFNHHLLFEQAIFVGEANFQRAQFTGRHTQTINFLGAIFKSQSFFINLTFNNQSMASPIDFRQVEFDLVPLIDSFPSNLSEFKKANEETNKARYGKNEEKFRVLKQLAEQNNNHLKATEFYACELYCHRIATGKFHIKNGFNFLYGEASDYGLSLKKPLIIWLITMIVGIFSQAASDKKINVHQPIHWERTLFYMSASTPPFIGDSRYQAEVRKRLYPTNQTTRQLLTTEQSLTTEQAVTAGQMPTFNLVVRLIQKIITIICLFLIGLALRNRFKIK